MTRHTYKQLARWLICIWMLAILLISGMAVVTLTSSPTQAAASNPLPAFPFLSGVKFRPNGTPTQQGTSISQASYCSSSISPFADNYYADTVFGCGYNISAASGSLNMASTVDPVAMYLRTESDYQHPVSIASVNSCYYLTSDPAKKVLQLIGCDGATLPMATNQWKNWVFVDIDNYVTVNGVPQHPSCLIVSNTATTFTCNTAISSAAANSQYFDLYRRDVEYGIDFQVNNNRYSLFVADVNKSDSLSCNCLKQLDVGVIAPTADINSQGFTVRKSPGSANDVMFNAGEGNAKIWGASSFDTQFTLGSGAGYSSAIKATGNGDIAAWSLFGQSYPGTFGVMTALVYDQNGANGRSLLSITNAGGTLDSTIGTASNGAIHLKANSVDVNGTDVTASNGSPTLTATTGFTTTPNVTATYQKIGRQVCLQIPAFSAVSNSTGAWFLSGLVSFTSSASGDLTQFAKVLDNGAEVDGYITISSTNNRVNFFKSGGAAWTGSGNKGLSKPLNFCYLSN